MSDIRGLAADGQPRPVRVDAQGHIATKEYILNIPFGNTTGAISYTTTLGSLFSGRQCELVAVFALWSSAPTTSQSFTVTLLSRYGTAYNVVLFSIDPSAPAATSIVKTWDTPYPIDSSDELKIAYTNTDARTIAGYLTVRPVS